jgi:hypothetical protein
MNTEADEKRKAPKQYHTPEISVYGSLTQITQSMQGEPRQMDNIGQDPSKTRA